MPEQYYKEALKLGQKEVRACVSRGEHPYLPLLDDFIPSEKLNSGIDLGTKWIPSELIVGTRTAARSNAFARNFMPILGELSEFATKWNALCNAHVEEGIRDPITCYEYMNRFYVEEGNKRVSVLKFFGAPTVYARVIRIMPEQNGSKEVELYNAFLDFQKCSRMHLPEFSKPQSYAKLQRLLGKEPDEVWTEDEKKDFMATYHYFREAYATQGKKEDRSVGDALLVYIEVYGYNDLRNKSAAEIKKAVIKLKEEFSLTQEEQRIEIKLDPQDKQPGLLAKVLPNTKPIKAAFIHDKTPETSGWTFGHECGRLHIERVFGNEIETAAYYNALDDKSADEEIEQAIADGATVIFTTSPRLLQPSLKAAVEHPKITVLNCSLNTSHRYIRTYYARMYEIKFIIGAIAGSLAQSNNVGYICDYPIFGQVAGINAFALGVQMVNPLTKVRLEWSSVSGGIEAATERLREHGIKLISTQDTKKFRERERSSFGLSIIDENGRTTPLARPMWLWGSYYEAIIRSIRDGTFKSEYEESNRALNYYWGLSAGVIDLQCYDVLPESVKRLASLLKDSICSGVEPFMGPLFSQEGKQIIGEEQSLTLEQIINMDWLVENVIGAIPSYEELDDTGKATADVVGVEPSTKEKQAESQTRKE